MLCLKMCFRFVYLVKRSNEEIRTVRSSLLAIHAMENDQIIILMWALASDVEAPIRWDRAQPTLWSLARYGNRDAN